MADKTSAHGQAAYDVCFDWGPTGAAAIAVGADLAVVVDVLSFTTTLSVAAERGVTVFPYRWRDATAEQYAADRDATLARGRSEPSGVTLSPASVLAAPELERLVLPSPNGSVDQLRPRRVRDDGGGCLPAQPDGGGPVAGAADRGRLPRWPWSPPESAGPTGRCGRRSRTSGAPGRCWRRWSTWA